MLLWKVPCRKGKADGVNQNFYILYIGGKIPIDFDNGWEFQFIFGICPSESVVQTLSGKQEEYSFTRFLTTYV